MNQLIPQRNETSTFAVVVAVLGFARHDRKPADQHVDQRGEPDRQREPAERIVVDDHRRAEHRKNHRDAANRRPLRRRRDVIKRAMRRRVGVRGAMRVSHRFVPSFDQRTTKIDDNNQQANKQRRSHEARDDDVHRIELGGILFVV